jgi:Beta-galactosidase
MNRMRLIVHFLLGFLLLISPGTLSSAPPPVQSSAGPTGVWRGMIDQRPQTGWTNYHRVLWLGDTAFQHAAQLPQFFRLVHEMGIDSITSGSGGDPSLASTHRLQYYVENIVNRGLCLKFNSNVKDWDKFITDWAKGGRPDAALIRDYSLDDPKWLHEAQRSVEQALDQHRSGRPFAYDLRDELSITYSANPFDYDFSPVTLAAFRRWLQTQYTDLAAINQEWETQFGSWETVTPFTTDRIKNRMASGDALPRGKPDWQAVQQVRFATNISATGLTAWNFSPWADFRTYMDGSLSRTLGTLRDAAHRIDPQAQIGIEGTQMAHAFGGYDLWSLSQVLDWIEPYDIGNSREILGSFMPGKPFMTTVFESDADHAARRLWHLLLEGDRGCIVWWSEDCMEWRDGGFALTKKAQAIAPVLKEMASPLAALFQNAEPEFDPIYLHYSQPSIQADWLMESTVDGSTWLRRFSSYEADHNRLAQVRDSWLKLLQDAGFSPRFISAHELAEGALRTNQAEVIVFPDSIAMSDRESMEVEKFLQSPGHVAFADGTPGQFDEHGRRRKQSPLESRFPLALSSERIASARSNGQQSTHPGDIAHYATDRLKGNGSEVLRWLQKALPEKSQSISVPPESHTRIRRYRHGRTQLVAFERNIDYHMSEELKQSGGNESLEKPVDLTARLLQPKHVYDLRTRKYLGSLSDLHFTLDPWRPSLFLLADSRDEGGAALSELEQADRSQ